MHTFKDLCVEAQRGAGHRDTWNLGQQSVVLCAHCEMLREQLLLPEPLLEGATSGVVGSWCSHREGSALAGQG